MNIIDFLNIVIALLIILGTLFHLVGSFGIMRLPDIYTRSHAATKSTTLGVICVLVGTFLFFLFNEELVSAKLLLGIVFVFLTSPVAGHLIGRAAYRSGVSLWKHSVHDDLKKRMDEHSRVRQRHS